MKPKHAVVSSSCSCTSCTYKSDSERPSLRNIIARGSRIDKLDMGKAIPLRERKLLDKLVRTRGVYDDIRTQLLSESEASISEKADLKPRQNKPAARRGKELHDADKSSAILELVNLVDKGVALGSRKISECCSCCSCGSTIPLHEHEGRVHRHGRAHLSSRSSMISGQRAKDERRKGKHMRHKAKHISSDPCTCACPSKLSEMVKRQSKALLNKLHGKEPEPAIEAPFEFEATQMKYGRILKDNKVKLAGMGETMKKSLTKIRQSKTRIAKKIQAGSKKSLDAIKNAEKKVKSKIEDSIIRKSHQKRKQKENLSDDEIVLNAIRDSIMMYGMGETREKTSTKAKQSKTRIVKKIKAGSKKSLDAIKNAEKKVKGKIEESIRKKIHKERSQEDNLSDDEIVFNAVRDSITKYREDLEKKSLSNVWECECVYDPEESEPRESFRIITKRRLHNALHRHNAERIKLAYKKIPTETLNASDAGIQVENQDMIATTVPNNEKIITDNMNKIDSITGIDNTKAKRDKTITITKNKNNKEDKCLCENTGSKTTLKTKSVKSNTSLLQKHSRASVQSTKRVPLLVAGPSNMEGVLFKKTSKLSPETYKREPEAKIEKNISRPSKTPSIKSNNRQAIKIGSSFSFSVEFYKEKPVVQPSYNEQKKMQKGLAFKYDHRRRHKSSNTSQTKKKNARNGGLALRRCFCTLKLKQQNKKVQEMSQVVSKSLQTMKISPLPVLLPYECEPMVCIPGECDPIECKKIIQKRKKNHSIITENNVNYKTRSTPSLTSKSVSSGEFKNSNSYKTLRTNNVRPSRPGKSIDKVKKTKQAVRISSNFSFSIEFNKEIGNSVYGNLRNTRPPLHTANKSVNSKRFGHLAHKPSQMSSTGKPKYTLTKHNLRRCFCTLKLAKPKTKNNKQTLSKGTLTSGQSLPTSVKSKPEFIDRAVEKREGKSFIKYALLPYECEPGICVPGECNPYKCLELINQRKVKTRTKQSGTKQRKTKSSYSITRKRIIPVKTANVQSISSSQKNSNVIIRIKPRETISSSVTPKQIVRIGSKFSFDIEFYKEKSPFTRETSLIQQPKQVLQKAKTKGEQSQQHTIVRHQKSSAKAEKKEQEISVRSNMKRCFCTLKLHKIAKSKNKIKLASIGTETATVNEEMYPKMEMATKSTNINRKKHIVQPLEPYECEPNFCVPGQCDPNQCWDRIKTRDQVKSKEFGTETITSKRKSVSSAVKINKIGKNAINQSFQKTKQTKKYDFTPSTNNSRVSSGMEHRSSSGQAVRIGSNFSFNVEFSKDRPSKYYSFKESGNEGPKTLNRPKTTHTGEHFRGKQGASQTLQNEKRSKSSGIRPILKRCFCTLKLQNNANFKNSPTVMPILIQNAFSAVYKEELIKLRDLLTKQPKLNETYSTNFSSTFSSSYTESSHYTINKDFKSYQRSRINSFGFVVNSKSMITKLKRQNTLIGVNQYLKSSFYAMNIQVKNKQKKGHKLKPYECEPGICIPGQCNPIECQKLIMKRLMRKTSTMTSTENRSQSSGALTHSKSKRQQYNKAPAVIPKEEKEKGFKYETLPRAHKQVVRVGSSFSFNIDFSKSKRTGQQVFQDKRNNVQGSSTNTNLKRSESKSTSGSQVLRQHRTSQSVVAMQDKGSNIVPKIKRCFCTLKIQKKGRQNKDLALKVKKELANKHQTADVGQNTKRNKLYSLSDLDPNECEPNICIPGKCDPHECLERIKKRGVRKNTKDFATDMKPEKTSASSMTSSKKNLSRGKQAHVKQKPPKAVKARIKEINTKPSRQAIRIGSSFSFNMEFFKDESFPSEVEKPSKPREHKQSKPQQIKRENNIKQKSIQDSMSIRHQDSQVQLPAHYEKSTKTGSLIKRCFCTANLHKQNELHKTEKKAKAKISQKTKASPSFLSKCFCAIKSLTAVKPKSKVAQTNKSAEPEKTETSAYSQTKKFKDKIKERNMLLLKLDPNECEPGVCAPGECNPLICKEMIRKRNANLNKMSSTEASNIRTTATVSESYIKNKSNQNKSNSQVKRQSKSENGSKSPERSAIRIGSNFSFSMEFYKENNPTMENFQKAVKEVKNRKEAATKLSKVQNPIVKAKGVERAVLLHNRESQVDHLKKKNKSSDFGPILKRCFCTLALRKHGVRGKGAKFQKGKDLSGKGLKLEKLTKGTETHIRKLKNQPKPYKLEPYECEPGVCVPGQCDPFECEKRIKRRHTREFGTKTMKQTSNSATTINKDPRKHIKHQNIQALNRNKTSTASNQQTPRKRISMGSKDRGRQAVRIGSNFSFNVEFSKSMTGGVNNFNDKNLVRRTEKRTDTKNQSPTPASSRHQKTQEKKEFHDAYSQVLAKKVRSTVTEIAPLLKRCFCTLTLKNEKSLKKSKELIKPIPKKVKNIKPPKVVSQVDKVINTDKPKTAPITLDPHECEPGTCVPGKCDPRQCLKRIQKRKQSKLSNTEAARVRKVSTKMPKSEVSSAETNTGIKVRHMTREAGDYMRTEKKRPSQSPTNSNKQVVRIGSNFSFNIEFFKDNSMSNTNAINLAKPEQKVKVPKQSIQKTSHTVTSSPSKFVNRQLQSDDHKTESKASGVGPIMKRCFCTLKLQKAGKLHQKVPKPVKKTKDHSATAKIKTKIEDSRISKDAGTRTNKKLQALEPYECEPNTCIPGKCNPLECYERIKLRHLNEFGMDTIKPSMKSISSLTDGKWQQKKMQTPIQKTDEHRSINSQMKRKPEHISHSAENRNRHTVRIGSSFNFDIEFHKEEGPKAINNLKQKIRTKPIKVTSQGSLSQSLSVHHKTQQAHVIHESVGSGIAPLLKRCFCTLTLHNTETTKMASVCRDKTTKVTTQNKSTSTKKQKKLKETRLPTVINDLDPNECEPGVCVPGKCNVHECLERIRKRGIHRQSRTTSANHRQCSTGCKNIGYNGRSTRMQSEDAKISRIVEQPRFPFIDPKNWQGVRIGSNFSFNIEFYKESMPPNDLDIDDDDDENTDYKSKRQSLKPTTTETNHSELHPQTFKTETKASIAGKALKRVFCSSKCQQNKPELKKVICSSKCKENKPESKKVFCSLKCQENKPETKKVFCSSKCQKNKPESKKGFCSSKCQENKPELQRGFCSSKCQQNKQHENVTVGRIDKIITMSPFKPRQYYIYQIKQHGNVCPDNFVKIELKNANTKFNDKQLDLEPDYQTAAAVKKIYASKDIKTILPFTARKFNKNGSNAFFSHNGIAKGAKNYCCSNRSRQGQSCNEEKEKISDASDTGEVPSRAISKHIKLTGKEKKITLSHLTTATLLKKIFCMHLFSNRRSENSEHLDIDPKCNPSNNSTPIKANADVLKKSKSAKCPEKYRLGQSKKMKSLKKTLITFHKGGKSNQQKTCYSRLQSGDANRRPISLLSENSLFCHCQRCITREHKSNIKYSRPAKDNKKEENSNIYKTTVFYMQHEKTCNYPFNATKANVKSLAIPDKPKNPGFLFQCVRKLSKCKGKFINSQISQIIHSGDRKSCCICKSKKPPRNEIFLKYSEQRNGPVLAKDLKKIKTTKPEIIKNTNIRTCACKITSSKSKANGIKKTNGDICVCFSTCACANYPKENKSIIKIKKIQPMKKNIKNLTVQSQQKKIKPIKVINDKNKYERTGDCMLLDKSIFDIPKLGSTVDCMLCSRKHKLQECSRTNYLINKYYTDRKNISELANFSSGPRKKPWFAVNYWFNRPYLSMLNIWKQFSDVVLFLLAVVVWRPCIFIVEGCRAAMCCARMS